jgi:hypothetical protein
MKLAIKRPDGTWDRSNQDPVPDEMFKTSPLFKRIPRSPIKKVRAKPRRGQPTKAEKAAIRSQVYVETGGLCEIQKHPQCVPERVWPSEGDVMERWHLVHLKGKRVHGWDRINLCGGCPYCHLISLHVEGGKGKIVPKKGRP